MSTIYQYFFQKSNYQGQWCDSWRSECEESSRDPAAAIKSLPRGMPPAVYPGWKGRAHLGLHFDYIHCKHEIKNV